MLRTGPRPLIIALLLLVALAGASCANIGPKPQQPALTPRPMTGQPYRAGQTDWTEAERQAAVFISAPVYFHYDSFDLTDEAKAVLRQKAGRIKEYPQFFVRIGGHCDERGTAEYNNALGAKRAQSALEYLARQGVARSSLEAVSYGKSTPQAPGRGELVWSQNRRADFSAGKP